MKTSIQLVKTFMMISFSIFIFQLRSESAIAQSLQRSILPLKVFSVPKKDPAEIRKQLTTQQHFGENELTERGHEMEREKVAGQSESVDEDFTDHFESEDRSPCAQPLKLGTAFEGNPRTPFYLPPVGYYASECAIAISNTGKIVSISNGWIGYYDETGSLLFSDSLYHFCSGLIDVRVQYDPKQDRFVFVSSYGITDFDTVFMQLGTLVAFSKSNDPLDGWNFYYLPDSLIGDNSVIDYPLLGISDDEVFITEVRFDENDEWTHNNIMQIDKMAGYAAEANINVQIFSDTASAVIDEADIVPAGGGSTSYGPNMYFVSAHESGPTDDLYFVYEVTNTIASGTAALNVYGPVHSGEFYSPVPLSFQKPGVPLFNVFYGIDDFVQNAFYENGILQFCQNTKANGKAAVLVGRISGIPNNLSCSAQTISHPHLSCEFPQIVYAGNSSDENSAVLGFEFTGKHWYPGVAATFIDNDFSVSAIKKVKSGEDSINGLWGDYSGICRRYNQQGEFWIEGQYGSVIENSINWISQLKLKPCAGNKEDLSNENQDELSLIAKPNPLNELTVVSYRLPEKSDVTIQILDVEERLIRTLADEQMGEGTHTLTWNAKDEKGIEVSEGIYFLMMKTEREVKTIAVSVAR